MLDFCAEGRGFDPQLGQKVISSFSSVTMYGSIDRYLIISKHDTGVPLMEVTR